MEGYGKKRTVPFNMVPTNGKKKIDNRTIAVLDHGHTHATTKWRKRWRTVPFNMAPTYGKLETWQSQFSIMGTDPHHNDVEKRQGKKNMVVIGKVVVAIARFKLEPQTNKNKLRFAYFQVIGSLERKTKDINLFF